MDEVLSERTLNRVYKRPESILLLVYTRAGDVLMLKRKRPNYFWQSVTGTLDWRESPRECAERELREETGLEFRGRLVDFRHTEHFPIIHPWRVRYAPGSTTTVNTGSGFGFRPEEVSTSIRRSIRRCVGCRFFRLRFWPAPGPTAMRYYR